MFIIDMYAISAVKSLNGLQMENTVSGLDSGPLSDHLQRVGLGSHAKLERQSSKGSKGSSTPSHKVQTPLANRADNDKQSPDLHGLLSIVGFSKHLLLKNYYHVCTGIACYILTLKPQNLTT